VIVIGLVDVLSAGLDRWMQSHNVKKGKTPMDKKTMSVDGCISAALECFTAIGTIAVADTLFS